MQFTNSPIWKRFEKSGLALEKLHKDTRKLFKEHRYYFDALEPWLPRFQALNNSILVVKDLGLDPEVERQRTDTIFAIGDLQKDNMEDNEKLVEVHPAMMDEIYDAGKIFEEIAAFLQKNLGDYQTCKPQLIRAEETLARVTGLYNEMQERLKKLREVLEKQKELYYQVADDAR